MPVPVPAAKACELTHMTQLIEAGDCQFPTHKLRLISFANDSNTDNAIERASTYIHILTNSNLYSFSL